MEGLAGPAAIVLVSGIAGYAIGSISSGYLVGKLYRNVDLRRVGSGSTGSTNTARTLGLGAGLVVAVLDILKGAVAVWAVALLVPTSVAPDSDLPRVAQATAAVAAVAGHCWPAFLAGRGGRGVATALGAFMAIATPAWVAAVAAFVVAVALTRMVSVGSLASVAGAFVGYAAFVATGVIPFQAAALGFIVGASAIIVWRHRPNIERIVRGVEPRVGQ